MMQNLSMHLLDIASNSVRANADTILIRLKNSQKENVISLEIQDNGKGMDEAMIQAVQDPFYTTRTTRRIGLGIPLFKGLAEQCEGTFTLESQVNRGTRIQVTMRKDHWDVPPLGDIGDAVVLVIDMNEKNHVHFDYTNDYKQFSFDSEEIKAMLDGVSICEPEIRQWCKDYINQAIQEEGTHEIIS